MSLHVSPMFSTTFTKKPEQNPLNDFVSFGLIAAVRKVLLSGADKWRASRLFKFRSNLQGTDVLQSPNALKFTPAARNLHLWGALSVTTSNKFSTVYSSFSSSSSYSLYPIPLPPVTVSRFRSGNSGRGISN